MSILKPVTTNKDAAIVYIDLGSDLPFSINMDSSVNDSYIANLLPLVPDGRIFYVICTANNDSCVLTFGNRFKSSGPVTPGSATSVVGFICFEQTALEYSRCSVASS